MNRSFKAQMQDIAKLTEKQIKAVVVDSVQDVLEGAQTTQPGVAHTGGTFVEGRLPVDTRSLLQSLEIGYDGSYSPTGGSVTLSAGQFNLGDTINARWTAEYALRIEQGFSGTDAAGRTYNQAGRFFVTRNAEKFSQFVARNAARRRV